MRSRFKIFGFLTVLSACGGAGEDGIFFSVDAPTGPILAEEATQLAAAFAAESNRIVGMDVTAEVAVPTGGQAVFDGKTEMVVSSTRLDTPMTLVGDTTMKADFGEGSFFTQMDAFAGATPDGSNRRFNGEIIMTNGQIGSSSSRNIVTGSYRGTLTGGGLEIYTDGVMTGQFRNAPIEAVRLTGNDTTALYGGERASVAITAVASD